MTKAGSYSRGPWVAMPLPGGKYELTCSALPGWQATVPNGTFATEALYQLQQANPELRAAVRPPLVVPR